jgi:hypothetical protein
MRGRRISPRQRLASGSSPVGPAPSACTTPGCPLHTRSESLVIKDFYAKMGA